MKKKNVLFFAVTMLMTVVSVLAGGGMMAVGAVAGTVEANGSAGENPNGGSLSQGVSTTDNPGNLAGVASQTDNDRLYNEQDAEGYDSRGLDRTIRELQPMKTPFDQLTRYASNGEKPAGMKFEYSSIGSRPIESSTSGVVSAMGSSATTVVLTVKDPQMFSVDDVVLCPDMPAITNAEGKSYAEIYGEGNYNKLNAGGWPCLQLKICGFDSNNGTPVAYAINGDKRPGVGNIITPEIPDGTRLLRVGKAVNEAKSETGRTNEAPNDTVQYCQIFMAQTEETLIHKLTKRDVNGLDLAWNERRTLEDFRMTQAGTFLFGDRSVVSAHPREEGNKCWYTGGTWWQAGNDFEFGHIEDGKTVVNEDDLVNLNGDLFVGEGTGGVKKLLFAGTEFLTTLEKIKSEKFRLKGDVQAWDLTFTSWKTTLGELLVIHDEMLDRYGKSDQAFVLDPEYFEKRVLLSLDRAVRDMDAAGIRATTAVRLKEISAVILYSPKAHSRLRLKKA
jgi:hypothetical protein